MTTSRPAVQTAAATKDRHPLRPLVWGAVVGVVATCLLVALMLFSVTRGLPADLRALSAWHSPNLSVILDAEGVARARFRLVDQGEWPEGEQTELVEAFLASAPPTFYEARSRRATSLAPALRRVLLGLPPPASPLSLSLSTLLLGGEQAGLARSLRHDLLASWLDSGAPLSDRLIAWLDRVPLCLGRRGLKRAARLCFDRELAALDGGELATLAVAAAFELDLAGDRDVLVTRRDAALDDLVVRGRLEPSAAAEFAARPLRPPRPSGDTAWEELVALGVRQALGRASSATPVEVLTSIDWELTERLRAALAPGVAFFALAPGGGAVLALGGDVLAPLRPDDELRVVDLAVGLARAVRAETAPGPTGEAARFSLRWTLAVDRGELGTIEGLALPDPLGRVGANPSRRDAMLALLGVGSLQDLPLDGAGRRGVVLGATVLLHEELVLVVAGDLGEAGPLLGERVTGAAFTAPQRYAWSAEPSGQP